MKKVWKILKVFLIIIAVIFVILIATPFLFKGKIIEVAKAELNKMLMAKVEFSDLKLSFIRNFPNAYIALENLQVTGTGAFEGDTLVSFEKFSITVDLKSVISMTDIQVKSILLDKARVYAHVTGDGKANWDIMKPSDTPEEKETEEESGETQIKISLSKFEIRDANITYRDEVGKMLATLEDIDFLLKGDMSMDNTHLNMQLGIAAVDFVTGGIKMLRQARVGFVSDIAADMKNMTFTFNDNQFNLNDISLKFEGSVNMPGDDITADILFATGRTNFKSLLSLIPAIYMTDFENVQTTGELSLDGYVKGVYNSKQMPSAGIHLTVDNAMFKYPDLPKSVNNIAIAAKLFYDGEVFDRTTVDVDKFHFEMADNPFDVQLHVKTPDSDMQIAGALNGKMDFNSISDIVPLENTVLNGILTCKLALAGRMSTLEKEQYEDFQAEGNLQLTDFSFQNPDFPQGVKISKTRLDFTPKTVSLTDFDAEIGRTDLSLKGSLENFIPYVFKDATIRGSLSLVSKIIDLNDLMADSGETTAAETAVAESPADTTSMSIVEVPKNIDFKVNAKINNLFFDKLSIGDIAGNLSIKDGVVTMDRLGMNMLNGTLLLSGDYNTQNVEKPVVDFQMKISRFDITSALNSFSMLGKMFDHPENYAGKVSADLTLSTLLDHAMSPVLNTVSSKGQLQTHGMELRNSKLFGTMADLLKNEKWRTISPDDMNIKFEIKDGQLVMTEPVLFSAHQAKVVMTGGQGLDMSLNYDVKVSVPSADVGAADLLSSLPGGASIKELTLTGLIRGTVTKPEVKLSLGDMVSNITEVVKEQVKEVVTQKIEEIKEDVTAQIDKLLEDVGKQKEALLSAAGKLAETTRKEADAAANKLEQEAASKNAIQKAAAKVLAEKLRKEGETKAKQIEQEAEKKAEELMNTVNKKVEELKNK
ncbi:MAG: AsmA family protein [Bacteroidales bacterium]|jgi:hypothetical protein|nr:AsmA family protein [Bacteroidales bacterium]